jgi:hypothetical protein
MNRILPLTRGQLAFRLATAIVARRRAALFAVVAASPSFVEAHVIGEPAAAKGRAWADSHLHRIIFVARRSHPRLQRDTPCSLYWLGLAAAFALGASGPCTCSHFVARLAGRERAHHLEAARAEQRDVHRYLAQLGWHQKREAAVVSVALLHADKSLELR